MRRTALLLLIGILCGGVVAWWLWRRGEDNGIDPRAVVTRDMLNRAVEVVAIAENGKDYRAAIAGWSELLAARPEDRELLLNQAVTVLKWINDTNGVLSSGTLQDAEAIAQLEKQLAEANVEVDRVLAALNRLPAPVELDSTSVLLESELLVTRSRAVPEDDGIQLRKQAAEKLIAALSKKPDQPLLAARLLKLSEELQLDWPEVTAPTTEAAYNAWRAHPRNLLLLIRAGQGLLEAKDKRLLEVIEASIDLAKPLTSMIKESDLKIAQVDTLVESTRKVVESGDWSKPPRVRPWFNILSGTSAFSADVRLLTPDVMALLNTSFLEEWRAHVEEDASSYTPPGVSIVVSDVPGALAATEVETRPLVGWYDVDVDRDFELLAIVGTNLRITSTIKTRSVSEGPSNSASVSEGPSNAASDATIKTRSVSEGSSVSGQSQSLAIDLPFVPTGFLIADFWTVDSPQRPVRAGSAAPSDQAKSSDPNAPSQSINTKVDGNSHDTIQEVLLWNEERAVVVSPDNQGTQLTVIESIAGLSDLAGMREVAVVELEGDGDLDLIVATRDGIKILQNNGNRTFTDITSYSSLPPSDWPITGLVACDIDRDLDLDIICTASEAPYLGILENILHNQLRFRALEDGHWRSRSALEAVAVLELDGNVSWDLALLGDKSLDTVLTRTVAAGQLTPTLQQSSALTGTSGSHETLKLGDLNCDGRVDVCLAGPRGVRVYWNNGQRLSESADMLFDRSATGLDIQDIDGDGRLELVTSVKGQVHVLKAEPKTESHYLNARVRGINDNVGGRINHYSIGSTLEVWADGKYQARVVDSPMTHFGLPSRTANDLRVIFNNGLTQNVLHPAADSLVQERQELKGSCPFVYGWDGERFQMITDLLWNAPLGLQLSRGNALPDRRWENLLLPGKLVQPRDGAIELRVTEELWEVAYFDHVQLTAIDHPQEVDVWTNEKVGPPSLAEPRLFTASRPIWPLSVRDGYGRDCRQQLHDRDQQYVQAFQQQICQGLCEPHSIELAFDPKELGARGDLRLVLTGWMHPTDTSLNIGISQNSQRQLPEPPSLWAPDASGQFVCKQPFMGFPGGKPKTIVIDLNGVWEGDDTRLRIQSTQQIYWDQAYLIANEPPVPVVTEDLSLQSARLHYRGFGRLMPRAHDQPHWYDYQEVSQSAKWPPLEGLFTRYGDVLPQMRVDDDHIVVMASGDEMILKFQLPSRPLPDGWTRDYVLHSVGWDKDADLNTLEGQSSLPLPFAKMKSYPPTLEDESEAERVWRLNQKSLVPRATYSDFWNRTKN